MEKRFPILGENMDIPWSIIEPHQTQAQNNHYQTLERLAERGGLGWSEALAVLEDRPWSRMDEKEAKRKVLQNVSQKCVVCGKPLVCGEFAYYQTTCWECVKMKMNSIIEEIADKSDKNLINWMMGTIAEQFGEEW